MPGQKDLSREHYPVWATDAGVTLSHTYLRRLSCVHCGATYAIDPISDGCPACRSERFASGLTATYDYDGIRAAIGHGRLRGAGRGPVAVPPALARSAANP